MIEIPQNSANTTWVSLFFCSYIGLHFATRLYRQTHGHGRH